MKKKNRLLRIGIFLAFFFALSLGTEAWAGTVVWDDGAGDGLWSTATNWDGDVVPTEDDDVQIGNYTVNVDGNYKIASLEFTSATGGTLRAYDTKMTYTLEVGGDITFLANTHFKGTNDDSYLNLRISGTSTVTTAESAVDNTKGFEPYDLVIDGTVTFSGAHAKRIENNLTITSRGSLTDVTDGSIYFESDPTISNFASASDLVFYDVDAAGAFTTTASFYVYGDFGDAFGGAFTASSPSAIYFKGANGSTTIDNSNGTITFYDVYFATSDAADFGANADFTIANSCDVSLFNTTVQDVTISASNVTLNVATGKELVTNAIAVSGTVTVSGDVEVASGAATSLEMSGTGSWVQNSGHIECAGATTGITVGANATGTFYDIELSGGGVHTLTATNNTITCQHDFTTGLAGDITTIQANTTLKFTASSSDAGTLTLADPGTLLFAGATSYITFDANSKVTIPADWDPTGAGRIDFDGYIVINATITTPAAFNITVGANATIETDNTAGFLGTSGDEVIDQTAGAVTFTWDDEDGVSYVFTGAVTTLGATKPSECLNLTLSGASPALNLTPVGGLTVAGNISITNNVTFDAGDILTLTGGNSTTPKTISCTGTVVFGILNISGVVTTTSSFSLSGTGVNVIDVTGTGSFIASGTSTITLTASADIGNENVLKFMDLSTGGTGIQIDDGGEDFEIQGDLTVGAGDTWDMTTNAGNTVTFSGSAASIDNSSAGTTANVTFSSLTINAGATVTAANIGFEIDNDLTIGSGATLDMNELELESITALTTIYNSGTCRLGIVTCTHNITTDDDVIIEGNIINADGFYFHATTPSVTTFAKSGTQTITNDDGGLDPDDMQFYDVVVLNGATAQIAANDAISIYGDLTINSGGAWDGDGSATTDTEFNGGEDHVLTVEGTGTATFGDLSVDNSSGCDVSTTGDLTILDDLDVGANASFTASGNSTITFSGAVDFPSAGTMVFKNLAFTGAAVPSQAFTVNGNISGAGTVDASAGVSDFSGTEDQTISVSGGTFDLFAIKVNKSSGDLKLGIDITVESTTAGALDLTNGNIDLNGNHDIVLTQTTNAVLSETGGLIYNSDPSGAGYIHANCADGVDRGNVGGLGAVLTDHAAAGGVINIKRYHSPRSITGVGTIARYYEIVPAGDAAISTNGISFKYDDSELPGGSEANLELYASTTSDTSGYATTTGFATNQESVNTSTNSIKVASGTIPANGGTGIFVTFGLSSNVKYSNFTTSTANWNDADSWYPVGVPSSSDYVIITANDVVLLNTDATVAGIELNGELKPAATGTYTLSTPGNVIFSSTSAVLHATNGAGKLNLTMTGGNATTPKKIKLLANANFNVNDLTVTGYLEQDGAYTIDISGDLYASGASSFVQRVGAVNFNGTTAQTITRDDAATLTFNDIVVADNASVTTSDSFTVLDDFTNGSAGTATFESTGGTITFSGTSDISNATSSILKFNSLVFSANTVGTTSSNFNVKGDFTLAANASFTASAGAVSFDNTATADITNNSSNNASDLTFWNIKVTNGSKVETESDFYIDGTGTCIEIQGTGSFKYTNSGTLYFSDDGTVTNSSAGTLEFWTINIPTSVDVSTTSDFTVKGDITIAGSGTLDADNPSTITLDNSALTITLPASDQLDFYHLIVSDESVVSIATYNYDIYGNLTILGSGSFNKFK